MHPIENIIETAMDRIKRMTDVSTVIGEPIAAGGGTVLLPVSKVSLGFIAGGGEYGEGGRRPDELAHPFAGGTTVGMCIKPTAFLSVEDGSVRVLSAAPASTLDRLTELLPGLLRSLERAALAMVDNQAEKCENKGDDCGRGRHGCGCESVPGGTGNGCPHAQADTSEETD
ncbi:MAG: sporulation protein YtfJ [Clostridia bacterium]|nr:sporulation protein YtfJ [Clostridia bacterium]